MIGMLKLNRFVLISILVFLSFKSVSYAAESTCYGTTSNGKLENGTRLPFGGKNFTTYSYLAVLLGRTYVHSTVKNIVVDAYRNLEKTEPGKVYKYAETGFQEGGRFKPHKTHQNGLSVDFMTPVINDDNLSLHLPTTPFNKYGYDIEFGKDDSYEGLYIDYEALAAHLVELHKESIRKGVEIWRVIFDPKLQPNLFRTQYGDYLEKHISFSRKRSWVRHDDHYHVDFKIPCQT